MRENKGEILILFESQEKKWNGIRYISQIKISITSNLSIKTRF